MCITYRYQSYRWPRTCRAARAAYAQPARSAAARAHRRHVSSVNENVKTDPAVWCRTGAGTVLGIASHPRSGASVEGSMPALPSCTSDRPNSWVTHRTLELPQSFVDAAPPGELMAWANALCCVYTHVETSSTSIPRLTTYDGDVKSYQSIRTAVGAMETVYDDVCSMSMGSQDCRNQRACVTVALEAAEQPLPPPRSQSESGASTWPIGRAVGVGIAGAVVIAVLVIVAVRLWTRRRRLHRPGTTVVTKVADGSEALEVEPTPPAATAVTV